MPRSRGRRRQQQPEQTQPSLPAPSPPQAHSKSLLQRFALAWSAVVSIGAIGGLWALLDRGWDVFVLHTQPKIEGPGLATDPFVLPFSIKNVGSFFEIKDAQWICNIPSLTIGNSSFTNLAIATGGKTAIAPNSNVLARCPIKGGANNTQATVTPIIKYKTLWIPRQYNDTSFTWLADANPPHWIEGRPIQ
jgi:hypothetical protein